MTEILEHPVHFTELDGSWLAASFQTPLFCVSAESFELARTKAERALAFHARQPATIKPHRTAHTIKSFSPVRVENLRAAELV